MPTAVFTCSGKSAAGKPSLSAEQTEWPSASGGSPRRRAEAIVVATLSLFLSACMVNPGKERILGERTEEFPASAIQEIRVDECGGSLTVKGEPTGEQIRIRAEFEGRVTSDRAAPQILEKLRFTHEITDGVLRLRGGGADVPLAGEGWINLFVSVPPSVSFSVQSVRGKIQIEDIGKDASIAATGRVIVSNVGGDLRLRNQWGKAEVTQVKGSVSIANDWGEVEVSGVGKDVEVQDSGRNIRISRVEGNVKIEEVTGSVEVDDVKGDLVVKTWRRGRFRHSNVQGKVDVPER